MAAFKEPQKFNVVPGNAADVTVIQDAASVLKPSMTDIFPAIYQVPLGQGGKAPERTTFNAFLKLYGEALYFLQRGGVWSYDATADYPAGAVVGYSGSMYLALGENGPGTGTGAVTPGGNTSVWQKLVLESGNAATATTATTATKLATARTIALSDAVTGTATAFDGSGNITIPVTALSPSAIRAQWYAAYPDGPEAHNAMWGGRDITAAFNNGTVSANIKNGTFKDIFPGDYITKQVTIPQVLADDGTTVLFAGGTYTVNWVVTDCDYWINKGDPGSGMTTHHVVIVPQQPIFAARMNPTNTTEGGYAGSEMFQKIIPACAAGIVSAFGSDHILTFRDLITNTVDNNVASRGYCGWTGASAPWEVWASVQCNLMTEHMVMGAPHYSSSGIDDEITTRQMSAFRLSEKLINYNRQWWWLRNVVSSARFASVGGYGFAYAYFASSVLGVRPFALLV